MPAAAIAAVATVGGAVIAGHNAKSAAKTAANAETAAAAQNAQVAQNYLNTVTGYINPYAQTGYAAEAALAARLGLTSPSAAAAGQPAAANGNIFASAAGGNPATVPAPSSTYSDDFGGGRGGTLSAGANTPDWNQLLQDRPDVMQAYQTAINGDASKGIPAADRNSPAFARAGLTSPQDYAATWYNGGGSQSYQFPQAAPPAATPAPAPAPQPAAPGPAPATGGAPDLTNAARPTTAPAPTYTDPTFDPAPTFGAAPQAGDFLDPSKFQTSPGYEWAVQQGQRNLNANFGARGLLKSGASLQGSIDYGQNQANQQYNNWFAQQAGLYNTALGQYNQDRSSGLTQYNLDRATTLNQFNTDRGVGLTQYNTDAARTDSNFNTDRAYQANRYDTSTGNLFNLASLGGNAINSLAGANGNYMNALTGSNNAAASATGNAALVSANAQNSAIGSAAQGIGQIYGAYQNGNIFAGQPLQTSGFPTMTGGQTTGSFNIPNFSYPTVGAF